MNTFTLRGQLYCKTSCFFLSQGVVPSSTSLTSAWRDGYCQVSPHNSHGPCERGDQAVQWQCRQQDNISNGQGFLLFGSPKAWRLGLSRVCQTRIPLKLRCVCALEWKITHTRAALCVVQWRADSLLTTSENVIYKTKRIIMVQNSSET